ncbi:hypothetical protein NKI56_19220 [Mesorhizobium sp. M0622]|uniref:hypothetical protein n=1 Tax=Mesorhizobium sp. M0622 TaxID=2956975 RepID=UPI00333C6558
MSKLALVVLGLLLGISQVSAGSREDAYDALRQGMEYPQARKLLVTGGWQAVRYPWAKAEERCGGRSDICNAFQEAEACAGTGMAQCRFRYVDGKGKALIVITVGEELPDLALDSWFIQPADQE